MQMLQRCLFQVTIRSFMTSILLLQGSAVRIEFDLVSDFASFIVHRKEVAERTTCQMRSFKIIFYVTSICVVTFVAISHLMSHCFCCQFLWCAKTEFALMTGILRYYDEGFVIHSVLTSLSNDVSQAWP